MATKSFLKNVTIKNKTQSRNLVNALEHAQDKKRLDVTFSRSYKVATKDEVRKMF